MRDTRVLYSVALSIMHCIYGVHYKRPSREKPVPGLEFFIHHGMKLRLLLLSVVPVRPQGHFVGETGLLWAERFNVLS